MSLEVLSPKRPMSNSTPRCKVFGECGGCEYQDLTYRTELQFKEAQIKSQFQEFGFKKNIFKPIIASLKHYGYRTRLDLNLLKTRKTNEIFMGFMPAGRFHILEVNECPIARDEISNFIPTLRKQAVAKLPEDYRLANLTVKTGADGRVFWGGIGRRSLRMGEKDYLWAVINKKKIFYSTETFFQINHDILPKAVKAIEKLLNLNKQSIFLDLYGGVGLFAVLFSRQVKQAYMIEEVKSSIQLAHYNMAQHRLKNMTIVEGKVENEIDSLKKEYRQNKKVIALVDPPRKGLSDNARKSLSGATFLKRLVYMSCNPETLVRDLMAFVKKGWQVKEIQPMDFFPRTRHMEVLVLMTPKK